MKLSSRHQKTLTAIFADPVKSSIEWDSIEALLRAAGAEITEGNGSRVRIALKDVRAVFIGRTLRRRLTREQSNRCGGS